jgi:predicted DNA-binding helix-hairpin-helix protein
MLKIRRHTRLRMEDLIKLKVALNRARPFMITADYNPSSMLLDSLNLRQRFTAAPVQLGLPF